MIETAMLKDSIVAVEGSSEVRTNMAGITIAIVARNRVEALALAAVGLNFYSYFPRPPKKIAIPKTKSRFPMIDPINRCLYHFYKSGLKGKKAYD